MLHRFPPSDVWAGMNSDVNDATNGKSFKVVPMTTETLYNQKTCFATEDETGGVVEIQVDTWYRALAREWWRYR